MVLSLIHIFVEHITYDTIEGSYDSSIFTAEKHALTMDKAYKAQKAIQDYVFTDGTAEKSVERKFAENLDRAEEVFIYAKLPKGFYIPTPVGHYSPDWAIVFHEGKVKPVSYTHLDVYKRQISLRMTLMYSRWKVLVLHYVTNIICQRENLWLHM